VTLVLPAVGRSETALRPGAIALEARYAGNEVFQEASERTSNEALGALSRSLVQVLRHDAGRGPTQAKSHWAGGDAVMVLFGGGFTRAEQTLWSKGRHEAAREYRNAIQDAVRERMCAEVERHLGRRVVASMSAFHHEPDLIAEIFVLSDR
jgi:uncharacterized protein YbcI